MTAWQYFAGAGLVAALCPLHGHVAVAGDGHGRGARVDLCVPKARDRPTVPGPPEVRVGVPSVRVPVPGADRPTVHHPGRAPGPRPARAPESPAPADAPGPDAEAGPAGSEPPTPGPAAGPGAGPEQADAPAPPLPRAAAAPVSAFHVRPYHSVALERRGPDGMSTMMLMVVVTTPAVLAAAALRPRSKSRG
ncbi:hypothetical protein ACGFYU_16740 [Streptomyces sp. NPDC048337]|uniref:hypothetical protein n=1 Tax=Streptomyces sp. NPDC048337 TaxID=3365535 RepID=UPI00371B6F26